MSFAGVPEAAGEGEEHDQKQEGGTGAGNSGAKASPPLLFHAADGDAVGTGTGIMRVSLAGLNKESVGVIYINRIATPVKAIFSDGIPLDCRGSPMMIRSTLSL